MEKRDLLRVWLRGKNIHIADIKSAMDWYDLEKSAGREPEDKAVLDKAEELHKTAVECATPTKTINQYVPIPMIDLDWLRKRVVLYSAIGTGIALSIYEGIKWGLAMIL